MPCKISADNTTCLFTLIIYIILNLTQMREIFFILDPQRMLN